MYWNLCADFSYFHKELLQNWNHRNVYRRKSKEPVGPRALAKFFITNVSVLYFCQIFPIPGSS